MSQAEKAKPKRRGKKTIQRQKEKDILHGMSKAMEAVNLKGIHGPVKDLAGVFWIGGEVDRKRSMKLMRRNRPNKFGRWRSFDDLTMLGKDVDETGLEEERFWFTVAPPYLEKDDNSIVYINDQLVGGKIKRFKSTGDLSKKPSYDSQWDSSDLVSDKILLRQQIKDVRGASSRLLEGEGLHLLGLSLEAKHNATFKQSVYGSEIEPKKQKKSSSNKDVYIAPVSIPKSVNAGDFLFGKEAYQYYLDHKRYLDEIEKEQLQPQINILRQRLVEKKAQVDTAVAKAREYYSQVYKPKQSLKERFSRVRELFTDKKDGVVTRMQISLSVPHITEVMKCIKLYP